MADDKEKSSSRSDSSLPIIKSKLWMKRLAWMVLIWTASVFTIVLISYALKLLMSLVGYQI
ncbi:MAG TPA: DUF2474 domain-containing protein [Methylotenera sp.]|nr:DUF2474 domain-containing protein [Methylotenera sp.]